MIQSIKLLSTNVSKSSNDNNVVYTYKNDNNKHINAIKERYISSTPIIGCNSLLERLLHT